MPVHRRGLVDGFLKDLPGLQVMTQKNPKTTVTTEVQETGFANTIPVFTHEGDSLL